MGRGEQLKEAESGLLQVMPELESEQVTLPASDRPLAKRSDGDVTSRLTFTAGKSTAPVGPMDGSLTGSSSC